MFKYRDEDNNIALSWRLYSEKQAVHQGCAEASFHWLQKSIVGEDIEKREHLYATGGNGNSFSYSEKQYAGSSEN